MKEEQKKTFTDAILLGLPGSLESYSLEEFRSAINEYKNIGEDDLRNNLMEFLKEIMKGSLEKALHLHSEGVIFEFETLTEMTHKSVIGIELAKLMNELCEEY